ncbi:MAG: hypothetical protein KBI47_20255 [Armatimonadetes bacterium]|nr:hypothetical protein [Armatimonadota bacterium]
MDNARDIQIIRDLAKQYAEIAAKPIQDERRNLWRDHNSLIRTRPLIYVRWLAAWSEHPDATPRCEDRFWQGHEHFLRQMIFQDWIGDDYIIEPWITQRASVRIPEGGIWGVPYGRIPPNVPGGAWKNDPPIKSPEDLARLVKPRHETDEESTRVNVARLQDAVGDILTVELDRQPAWTVWHADMSTDLGYLRGIDTFMMDMLDDPGFLHELVGFMSRGILDVQEEAEKAGDWSLSNHQNQAMPYARELSDPAAGVHGVSRKDLWVFCAAQEFALVSPAMHEEFLFNYQYPILEKFGLVAYGCCEDLTRKVDMLSRLPNLRRVAVVPVADVAKSAEVIGDKYVFSWRPNPSQMICCGWDPDGIRKVIREGMQASKGCHVDITLKDVQTVLHRPELLRDWVEIVRSITDEY